MADKPYLPDGWRMARLGDVLKLEYGVSLPEPKRRPGRIPVIGSAGAVGFHDHPAVEGPGVVVGRKGSIGSVTWIEEAFVPIDTTYLAVPIDEQADLLWIYHLLACEDLSKLNRATGVPGLNRDDVYALKRPIPPLPEQRAIAAVLDSIDEAIEGTEAVIAAAERLRDALLHELLTRGIPGRHSEWRDAPGVGTIPADWEVARLGDVAEVVTGSTPPREVRDYYGEQTPWVKPSDLAASRLVSTSEEYLSEPGVAVSRLLPQNAVLVSCIGTIGEVAIAKLPLCSNQQINALIPSDATLPSFLYWVCLARSSYLQTIASKTAVPILNKSAFSSVSIPFPSFAEQQAIAAVLDGVDEAIEQARAERDALQWSKASVSDALLTGRVRVAHKS